MHATLTNLLRTAAFSTFLFAFSACSKEKEEAPPPPPPSVKTNKDKILGKWIYTSRLQDTKINDVFEEVSVPCERDDYDVYKSDSTAIYNQGAFKCASGLSQESKFTWKLEEENILYISHPPTFNRYKIAVLNDTLMVLHRPLDLGTPHGRVYAKITYRR